nr:zinc finger, CCHC-type [Tanacetum cinerariifolium]
ANSVVEIGLCGNRFDKYRHKRKERKLSGNILWKTNSSRHKKGKHQREEQVSNAERIRKLSFGCGQKSKSTHEKGIRLESAASTVTIIDDWIQTLQMKEDDTMDVFTAKLNGYATKAKELGKTLDESLLVRKLLDSTPDRFIQIVASIEQTNDLDDLP